MKKIIFILTLIFLIPFISCTKEDLKNVQSIPSLIREGFINNNEYEIVCMGFPKQGLTGIQKEESAKRAALLNAYYYTEVRFDDTVKPDTDGRVAKIEISDDHATVYYVITKTNLKSRLKK